MNDKEMLELAAKSAGIELTNYDDVLYKKGTTTKWNPLDSNEDAFKLMVDHHMKVDFYTTPNGVQGSHIEVYATDSYFTAWEDVEPDHYEATRRAIVRLAARKGRMNK